MSHIDDKDKYADVEPVAHFVVKDSGQREEFETGSRRDTREGKGRFDLIPTYPQQRLADLYEKGAIKYGDRNWERGQPLMRYLDSAQRHLNMLIAGETSEDHAAAINFNVNGYMNTLAMIEAGRLPKELDDRPEPDPRFGRRPTLLDTLVAENSKIWPATEYRSLVDGTEGGDVLPSDCCPAEGRPPAEGEESCCGGHHPAVGLV